MKKRKDKLAGFGIEAATMSDQHESGGAPIRPPIINPRRELEDLVDTLAKMVDEYAVECDALQALLGEAGVVLHNAGDWIVNADVAVEPGWLGSASHILRRIEVVSARIDAQLAKGAGSDD